MKNMKKLIITIGLFAAISCLYLSAQSEHEISVYGGGGLSTMRYQLSQGNSSSGLGGDFGVGYTYFRVKERAVETGKVFQEHWGIHTGIGIGLYNAKAKLNEVKTVTSDLYDSDGDRFNLHSSLSNYGETQTAMFLNIPVMAQFQIEQFYVMCGIKTGIPLKGKYKSKDATLTNEAYYPKWENWARTQTFAGFGSFKGRNSEGVFDLGVNVMLAVEAGMNWRLNGNLSLYSGAYFDYGLINVAKDAQLKFINYSDKNPEGFTANSVLSSYSDNSNSTTFTDKVNTMAVGIKVRLAYKL